MSKNLSELGGRKGVLENLFSKIGDASAAAEGSPSPEDMERLAEEFLVGNTSGDNYIVTPRNAQVSPFET